ncbi:MAG: hypothetical protein CVV02_15865 [Firmicutes bacterium HGW-Firmicutes-7]|nr:MAG: hypothetical protein CVV02_15865 [Firmicutes bacterium HGW-Firmicutes-7]
MSNVKKKVAMLLTICILVSNLTVAFADETSTVVNQDYKANVLNSIGILKGTGTSLNLEGKLKRKEAATFIVRLMGVEDVVTSNPAQYAYTSYTDVSPDEWYAPYVGYCDKEGIINGFDDSTFKPEDYLSEKEFLKMVLITLEYRYNVDFSWDNVYHTAYVAGVVKSAAYSTKVEDKKNYSRGEVAEVIYEALKLQNQETKELMIQTFIDNLTISKEEAIQVGLMQDDVDTEIKEVKGASEKSIEITFNEKVKDITLSQIQIYLSEDSSEKLTPISIATKKDNAYLIEIDEKQLVDEDYTIIVSGVVDQFGNHAYNSLTQEFTGYRPDDLESDFFKISKVKQISNNILYVYFTQPVNDNALQPSYYTLKKDNSIVVSGSTSTMQINRLPSGDNGVSVFFKSYLFEEEVDFTWAINGDLISAYGVRLNDGAGDFVKFESSTKENKAFELEDISTPNRNTIELSFNKLLNPVIAQQVFSYYLTTEDDHPIKITKAEVKGNGEIVHLTTEDRMYDNDDYIIMINNITDTTKQFSISEREYDFECDLKSVKDLEMSRVSVIDANTINVTFNRALDYDTASDPYNYEIRGVSDRYFSSYPSAVYYEKGSKIVKLFLPKEDGLEDKDKYDVVVIGILKDDMGNAHNYIDDISFKHNNKDRTDTIIDDAKIIGSDTIRIEFNSEIALDVPNVLNTNYKLTYLENGQTYTKIPIAAIYISPKIMVLKFDTIDMKKEYEVTFTKLVNYGKIVTDNSKGKYSTEVELGK